MKFYGVVGYGESVEGTGLREGIWEDVIVEKPYYGDVTRNTRRWDANEKVLDDLNVSNTISIVADAFAYQHFFSMKYVEWMGTRWKISSVEVQRPRIILTIGGVYNGPTPATA